jgi:8-oxo-dGTP diphosphatase
VQIVQVRHGVPWLEAPCTVSLVVAAELPPAELISTGFVLGFDGDALLMADIRGSDRGWNPPGGHVERGEDALAAALREAKEETGADLADVRPFGYQHISIDTPEPVKPGYPHPESFQVFFIGRVVSLGPFEETEEVVARRLFTPAQARDLRWVRDHLPFYEAALAAALSKMDAGAVQPTD